MEPVQGNNSSGDRDEMLIEEARREMRGSPQGRRSDTMTNGGAVRDGSTGTVPGSGPGDPTAPASGAEPHVPRGNGIPERIAHYHVKRRIAATHMSVVYEATQEHPRRTVAIKVMRRGRSSRRGLRRFQYESQVLARLRHPCIAHVYDAGWYVADGERLPYFAMEYLPNARSMTEYASQRKLPVRQRLGLFVDACEALHHGHQRGVIHRDVKPGNILVDGDGQVKVIDFGVARATDADMNVTTQQTSVGDMVGTLWYMSPEQCKADPNDLDIRSDIYSLGVVLYELLAGQMPYDLDSRRLEALKIICEEPPTPLSTVDRSLRGDLETIAGKALEKDRRRRYQSALALADDIKRYLSDEPIQARPPSAVYRFKKLVRRRRVPFGVTAAVLLALSVASYFQIDAAFARAEAQRKSELLEARGKTMRRAMRAAFEAFESDVARTRPRRIAELANLIELDPSFAIAYAIRARWLIREDRLDEALADCDRALQLEPSNSLALRTKGFILMERGDFEAAREVLDEGLHAFGFSDAAMDYHNRARLLRMAGDYPAALEDHDHAVALAPQVGITYQSRGITRLFTGNLDGAVADFQRCATADRGEDPWACNMWIWETRSLRREPGDREAAMSALARAAEAAEGPLKKELVEVMERGTPLDAVLPLAPSPKERCRTYYYFGVKALVEGRREDARGYFESCRDESCHAAGFHARNEYDLAQYHLTRMTAESGEPSAG